MKKHLLFLTLAAVLSLLPFGAKAQDTLTVADSTASLSYLPFYSLYADYGTESEFIYPAEMLEAMVGGSITSMSFYKSSSDQTWDETFTVEIEEVSAATYSSAASQSSNPTLVWTGVPSTSNGVWTIELDEPYTYSGENLLIHVKTVGLSSGICPSLSWKGITSTGSGIYRYASSSHVFSNSYTITGYLPKCTFTYEAGSGDICYRPKGLTITNISSDGVDITWVDTLNTSATYDIVAINNDDTMVLATNYTGFSYSISGLTANTAYTIGVRSVCSAESASSWLSSVCRTSCADISELPYRDGFESYVSGSGNFPVCWYKLKTTYSPSTYPYTYASGVVGSQSLYWYTSTANDTVVICTPSLPIDASSMHVSFWMGSNASTEIGILTDTADLTTFVPMLTVNNENYWRQYDIYTDTIDGMPSTNETFLAFRTVGHAGNTSVDDVLVEPISSCRRPTAGDFSAVTHNSITITWTPDEVTTGTYEVLMSRISQISATDTTAVSTQGIAGNTFTATDLTPNTVYYFWVRSECGSEWYRLGGQATYRSCYPISGLSVDNVNYSSAQISWNYNGNGRGLAESGVHIILRSDSTILREWDVPYTEGNSTFVTGLEDSSSYTVEVRTLCDPDTASSASVVAFTTATCGSVSGATAYTTNSYVPFHRYYKYGISQILYPASAVSAITGGITGIAFSSTTDRNYAYTVDVYLGETSQSTLSTSTAIPLNQLTLVASNAQMTSHIGFNNINFTTPYTFSGNGSNIVVMVVNKTGAYDGSGLYWTSHSVGSNVAIYAYTDGSAYDPATASYTSAASYRPDIKFLGQCNVECLAPNLALVSTDINSVSLRWARGAEESAWAVQYTADSVWVSAEDAGDTMVTIDGLAANTSYRFRVGTICDDESIMWSNVIEARTGCEPLAELPFTEGFENMPSGGNPACWQVVKTGTSSSDNYYVSTTSPHAGQQCMYFYPYGYHYLISPVMPAGTDPADLEISFWGKIAAGGSTRIEVGLMTDPTDLNTFVVFRVYSSGGYAAYIDDIGIGTAQCRRPRSLQATSVLDTAVTITWLGMAGATYEYYYGMVDTIPADANILTTDATPLTIEGLMPSSSYNFWVRSVCGENVTAWSSPLAIRTACGVVQMPWSENFDNWSSIDECWARYSGQWMDTGTIALTTTTSGWNINSTYGNLPIQGKALTANLYSTNKYWIVTPAIAVEGTIVLSFDIAAEPWSSTYFDNDDRFIVAATTDSGATWTPLYMLGSDPTRDDGTLTDLTSSYTTVNVPISGFDGDTVQIGFYEASISSGGDSRILIDNLSLGLADCLRPSSIREIVDAESATITWRDFSTNNTSGFEFIFSPTNNMNDSAAVSQILGVGDTSVTFTGLTPQTTYYYFLRSTCEDTPTANSWVRGSIRTLCRNLPHRPNSSVRFFVCLNRAAGSAQAKRFYFLRIKKDSHDFTHGC